jgi:hypothetical protein
MEMKKKVWEGRKRDPYTLMIDWRLLGSWWLSWAAFTTQGFG